MHVSLQMPAYKRLLGPLFVDTRPRTRDWIIWEMRINLAEDTITKEDVVALSQWLLTFPHLTKGSLTEEFESAFANYMGSKYAVLVSSGSSANLIAANALRVGKTKQPKVIVPAVSWVTTVTPFVQLGYNVLMCDCDSATLGVNIDHFELLCREHRPDAAIIVHVLGHDSSIKAIRRICDEYDVDLVEDTCEAIGSEIAGRKLGTFGKIGTFSLYFGHQISSIEGGVLITDSFAMSQIAKSMRAHGWARDLDQEVRRDLEEKFEVDPFESLYTFYYSGFNCRSTDLNAFLGLRQLKILPEVVKVRDRNYRAYADRLFGFWTQTSETKPLSSFAYGMLVQNRRELAISMKRAGIDTRPLICGNMARQPVMGDLFQDAILPTADVVHRHGLYLPNHLGIGIEQIDKISEIVKAIALPLESVISK